ncbi:FAD-binding domain-containing protein [Periconia macrospinosa]|uniref:FAD-binding domain-containing protein n=1 Tax=Periconia macrospinosa TaxID=97972 RepID=A0A2V1DAB5_9PLEO|nr:FAD-binding domain-containing protein [Periconia macrospinosa]
MYLQLSTTLSLLLHLLHPASALPSPPSTYPAKSKPGEANALTNALAQLHSKLSPNASVILPTYATWNETLIRGSSPRISPGYQAVVNVATEGDIAHTLAAANRFDVPVLATAGTHGWTRTLNQVEGGIQIRLRGLNGVKVEQDGKAATIGGGILQWEIVGKLYEKGLYAVTGLCECVSVAGPLLGGGHSILQASHGFAADNLVSARVVLYNGTVVTASEKKNPDLFWGLRGAGHNFGIVASLKVKTHPIQKTWTTASFFFTQEKLEALLELVNRVDEAADRSPNLVLLGVITRIPPLDPKNPAIVYSLHYEGSVEEAAPYHAQFKALGPVRAVVTPNVTYKALQKLTGNSLEGTACRKNLNIIGNGASLPTWNGTAGRAAYNVFSQLSADPRFNTSALLLENYGMNNVRAVNADSTALPPEERKYPIVANPSIWYKGDNPQTEADAYSYGERIRQEFFAGSLGADKHTYVNYAIGTETYGEMYGYEDWRTAKLKGLKRTWDPKNRFGYYNPVPIS